MRKLLILMLVIAAPVIFIFGQSQSRSGNIEGLGADSSTQNRWLNIFLLQDSIAFEHITSAGNISANSSTLDHSGLNGNPNAIVMVYPVGDAATKNYNAIGVWYNGSRWLIFNQNRVQMPEGVTYRIVFFRGEGKTVYTHSATAQNTAGTVTTLQHPQLENNQKATVRVTQNWNPGGAGGVYNDSNPIAEYRAGRWTIRNLNGNNIPVGAAFNIIIFPDGELTIATTISAESIPLQKQNPLNTILPDVIKRVLGGPVKDVDFDNWGFEKGKAGWYPEGEGDAFLHQPAYGNNVVSQRVLTGMELATGGIGGDYWKQIPYPIGIKGNRWIGTYEQRETEREPFGGVQGDAQTGVLSSEDFIITKRFVEFLIGGGSDASKLRVEVQVKLPDKTYQRELTRSNFRNSEEMSRVNLNLAGLLNKTARIRIVDQATGSWGHINVDDFRFVDEPSATIPLTDPATQVRYFVDTDKPVWGYGDLHAHWVNHVGLRGLMHGRPGGNWRTSNVRTDIPPCDGFNHNLPTITPGLLIAQAEKAAFNRFPERLGDPGNSTCAFFTLPTALASIPGSNLFPTLDSVITKVIFTNALNPAFQACGYQMTKDVFAKHYNNNVPEDRPQTANFVDFPRWNTFFHQMMHITWVRRSYEGGQRLMVVPIGTAKSFEFTTTDNGTLGNQRTMIQNSVEALKTLVQLNSDWMEIALTAQDARRIILNNKMAVVVMLEQAEVGNYGFANEQQEVNWLHSLGIRHIIPIHNIDNRIGGAAVFNSTLLSYQDIVNRESQNSPIVPFNLRNGMDHPRDSVSFKMKRGFMRQGIRLIPIAGFGNIPFFYLNDVPENYGYDTVLSHKNAKGLTNYGESYINEVMKKGMVIEVDHMSDLAQNRTMQILGAKRYPMVSGHANFRELRWPADRTDGKEDKLRTEYTITDARMTEISDAGGMFGIMTQQNDTQTASGNPVENTSAGSSRSFSQAYWYTLQKTGGKRGIAFGSDFNGFAPQTAPRFGVDAAYYLEGDDPRNPVDDRRNPVVGPPRGEDRMRRTNAFQQTNGVRYDSPILTYHYHRFLKPPFLTSEEREIWEAMAMAKTPGMVNRGRFSPDSAWQPLGVYERTAFQRDKVKNLAKGFLTNRDDIAFLDCPEYISGGDCMAERKAAFMSVNGEAALPANLKDARTMELYRVVKPIYDLWMQFENGPNEPLRRSFAYPGGRDFDFNLDGLAHYGMFPDMIQDMKNTGLTSVHLTPLFMGAEEYIRMWEKADLAKNR